MQGVRSTVAAMERIHTDTRGLAHAADWDFPEKPQRLADILARVRADGRVVLDGIDAPGAVDTDARIRSLHDSAYVDRFARAVARGDGLLDSADNPLSSATWEAAVAAVATAMQVADWVAAGEDRQSFAAVRPPGHHAERDTAMGYCFFGNVALAAQQLIDAHGCERVAIVDFDVHHGNGTQHIFEARADVLVVNLHQHPLYPGTGAADERGVGPGEGATLNLPLPAGSDDARYAAAFRETVLPALGVFEPEVLLVSAGFDTWREDPLGGMEVSAAGFWQWGQWLRAVAEQHCGGRMVSVLEGGYDLVHLPDLVTAYLDGVAGAELAQ